MKKLLVFCSLSMGFLSSCGSGGGGLPLLCEHSLNVGVWQSSGGDLLNLEPTCEGSSSYCESKFTYASEISELHLNSIKVESTNSNAKCPQVGMHTCKVIIETNMRLDCGFGEVVYVKVAQ